MTDVYKKYQAPGGTGGGLFLRLESDKPVKVRIMSEPYLFTQEFEDKISTKYAWIVYNQDEKVGQILQLPVTGFRMIQELASNDEWGDPANYDLKIGKTGERLETRYSVTPSPTKNFVTTEMKEAVKSIDMKQAIKNAVPLQALIDGEPAPSPSVKESSKDVVIEDLEDEVNLDDIPF